MTTRFPGALHLATGCIVYGVKWIPPCCKSTTNAAWDAGSSVTSLNPEEPEEEDGLTSPVVEVIVVVARPSTVVPCPTIRASSWAPTPHDLGFHDAGSDTTIDLNDAIRHVASYSSFDASLNDACDQNQRHNK